MAQSQSLSPAAVRSNIGSPVPRPVTRRHLSGRGRFTDDLAFARIAHVAFLRSPYARARVDGLEVAAARAVPGVLGVFAGEDLAAVCDGWKGNSLAFPGLDSPLQRPLAIGRASYAGEAVVAVVAIDRAIAEDALELIDIQWTEEEATRDLETAIDAAPAHPDLSSNIGLDTSVRTGDAERAFAEADVVVRDVFRFPRQTGVTLEPRSIVADFDPAERRLTVHVSHQVPVEIQSLLARFLRLPLHHVRVVVPDVGGGFGIKLHLYSDDVAVAALSVLLGRPVKYVADRMEAFATDVHAREHVIDARLAMKADGTILGLEVDDLFGMGAYSCAPRTSLSEGMLALRGLGAPYRIPNFAARIRAVFQNRTPNGQYRAVGMPISCTVTERLIDHAAAALGIDPAEMRSRNLVATSGMPCTSAGGMPLFELSQHACLEKLLALCEYERLRAEIASLREKGVYRGLGLAACIEPTGPGPDTNGRGGLPVVAVETVTIKLEPSGEVRCLVGVTDQGQGTYAGIAQVVADSVGVAAAAVSVLGGDTERNPVGGGAWASRGMTLGGEAAWLVGRALRAEVLRLAGALLQADPETLDIVGGQVTDGDGVARLSLREIAETVYFRGYLVPGSHEPQLTISRHYQRPQHPFVPTNGVQASYVEVDVELGKVKLLRHWVVEDCGRVVNPLLVDEQIRGGVVQGIGPALFEAIRYDERGQLLTATLFDYLTPSALDAPDIVIGHVETPYSGSELGAKGVGEAGTCASGAAVLNAVNDALAPFGAAVTTLPMTPRVILAALDAAHAEAAR